jgi:hypothetical protein
VSEFEWPINQIALFMTRPFAMLSWRSRRRTPNWHPTYAENAPKPSSGGMSIPRRPTRSSVARLTARTAVWPQTSWVPILSRFFVFNVYRRPRTIGRSDAAVTNQMADEKDSKS